MSVNPREAAIAAALTGAVVVVLGYASGFGLRTPVLQAAVLRPPASTPTMAATTVPAAVPAPPPMPAPVPVVPVAQQMAPAPAPVHQYPAPPPPASTPESSPAPARATATCEPGVLDGVLGPLDTAVSTLLGGGLLEGLLGTDPTDGGTHGLLTCSVGALTGSTCCPTAALRTSGATR